MIKKLNENRLFILILIFGALVRLLYLGNLPLGLFRDEAALGYNAYSIFLTGKDEYGVFLPLVFRSFEVFFLPTYVYLSAPIVGILGLTEFSTRLLSGLSGIVALIFVYLIAKELWNKKVALFSTFVLAIAPWHIFYSRGAFEGNLALTLFTGAVYFWIRFLKKATVKLFTLSTMLFVLSMYSYQAERVMAPLFGLFAITISFKKLWKLRRKLILPIGFLVLLLMPMMVLSFTPGGYHRAFGVSVFSKQENPPGYVEGRDEGFLVNNKVYLRGRQVASLYLSYFSPSNLFIEGDYDQQRSVDNFSVFYAAMLPFMIWGFYKTVENNKKPNKLILFWTLLAPVTAALTGDPFHTYRSLLLYFPLTLFVGYGLFYFYDQVRKRWKLPFILGISLVFLASFAHFVFSYSYLTQISRARAWDYGHEKIVDTLGEIEGNPPIVVWDRWTEPYIHFLFFGKVDPSTYHKAVQAQNLPEDYYYGSTEEVRPEGFANYEFREVSWREERGDSGTYFVMYAEALPESEFNTDPKVELVREIFYPNGKVAYRIVRIKE